MANQLRQIDTDTQTQTHQVAQLTVRGESIQLGFRPLCTNRCSSGELRRWWSLTRWSAVRVNEQNQLIQLGTHFEGRMVVVEGSWGGGCPMFSAQKEARRICSWLCMVSTVTWNKAKTVTHNQTVIEFRWLTFVPNEHWANVGDDHWMARVVRGGAPRYWFGWWSALCNVMILWLNISTTIRQW